jgi:tetratricopeptide (TPR) repeat protein
MALINLEKLEDAIECFEEALKINPNYAEAYENLGITLLNLGKYEEAIPKLRTAKEIFSKRGAKEYADDVSNYELWALNASKLMSELKPLDDEFIRSLNSQSLTELRDKISKVSKSVRDVFNIFEKRKLPENALTLLNGKVECFMALSDSLNFKKVDLKKLEKSKRIFDKWGFDTLISAVNSIDTVIRYLMKYNSIESIPKGLEKRLLNLLSNIYDLDGILTGKMSDQIMGEPYPIKFTDMETNKELNIVYERLSTQIHDMQMILDVIAEKDDSKEKKVKILIIVLTMIAEFIINLSASIFLDYFGFLITLVFSLIGGTIIILISVYLILKG